MLMLTHAALFTVLILNSESLTSLSHGILFEIDTM